MAEGGDFVFRDSKWFAYITAPDKVLIEIGPFDTREEAGAAYLAKQTELYPLAPAPKIDPKKHHSMTAAGITTKPFGFN